MSDRIITREGSEYQELYRNLCQAIRNLDILFETHRPSVCGRSLSDFGGDMLYFQYQ